MKRTRNFVVALLFTLLTLFPGFMPKTREAKALSSDYFLYSDYNNVYYFSDSTPAFKDIYEANFTSVPITYDIHPLMTNQELAFLLYSGYFWGFNRSVNNMVIIEIKSAMPDPVVLQNLFACLHEQGCKVFFISSYISELGDTDITQYADASLLCNMDKYSRYLKNAVKGMLGDDGLLRDGTSVLMSGKFFGLQEVNEVPEFAVLCKNSPTLRRLLLNMYYNCDKYSEPIFEETLYKQLWQTFKSLFFGGAGWDIDLDYFSDPDMSTYIENWRYIEDRSMCSPWEYYASQDEYQDFQTAFTTEIGVYYGNIADQLRDRDIHLLANVKASQYVDLLDYEPGSVIGYTFEDYENVYGYFSFGTHYFYSMGITSLTKEFKKLLENIQIDMPAGMYENVNRIPYIWEDDPIVWGGSLIMMLEDEMQDTYGDQCGGCSECLNQDTQDLEDMFLELLNYLLN